MPISARIVVLSLLLLAATCGQKGPLTLPEEEAHSGSVESAAVDSTA